MDDDLDQVWKALADPTRRSILDKLKDRQHTTGELCSYYEVSRYAVMKHLNILVDAGLVLIRRDGRKRFNFLNPVPLRRIYERWISLYSEIWSKSILDLKRLSESNEVNSNNSYENSENEE